MGSNHHDAFRGHFDRLVAEVDPDLLRQSLFSRNAINQETMDSFKEGGFSRRHRLRRLLKHLETHGMFSQLLASLADIGQGHLATLLDPASHTNGNVAQDGTGGGSAAEEQPPEPNRCHPTTLPEATPEFVTRIRNAAIAHPRSLINVGKVPPSFTVRLATQRLDRSFCPDLQVYPMGSNPKGLMLLINNVRFEDDAHNYRGGAEVDQSSLTSVYEKLGYQVIAHRNLPLAGMKKEIEAFAKHRRLREVCALTVALMSHGLEMNNRTMLVAYDGSVLDIEWVVRQFDGANCPEMIQKPKVFLFQMCRGLDKELGVAAKHVAHRRTEYDGSVTDQQHLRSSGDILIAHSTLPGYVSNRDLHLGTWYVQAVCEVFAEHACDTDLEDMLKMVDSRLSRLICEHGTMQASSYENRGFRKFFFVPGLFDCPTKPGMVSRGTQSPCQPERAIELSDFEVEIDFISRPGPREVAPSPQPMSQGSQPNGSNSASQESSASQSSGREQNMSQGSQPNESSVAQHQLPSREASWLEQNMTRGSQPSKSDLSQWRHPEGIPLEPMETELHLA